VATDPSQAKLLVLDLDETLVYADEARLEHAPDFEVGPYAVYRRPGLDDFLRTVGAHFRLGVWTSSSEGYARPVVENVFPAELTLEFVWSRDRCTRRFFAETYEYEWAKNLDKLKRRGWDLGEVLMVDDTPAKLAKHCGNLVRVRPFLGDPADDELPALAQYLLTLVDVANVRKVEKRRWRRA
jgi:RNA polymerase II subunit A small phosphatase-like protein